MNTIKQSKIGLAVVIILMAMVIHAGQVLYNNYASQQATSDPFFSQKMIVYQSYEADANTIYYRYEDVSRNTFIKKESISTASGGVLTTREYTYDIWTLHLLSGYSYSPINN